MSALTLPPSISLLLEGSETPEQTNDLDEEMVWHRMKHAGLSVDSARR